jgi:hypothetical protein
VKLRSINILSLVKTFHNISIKKVCYIGQEYSSAFVVASWFYWYKLYVVAFIHCIIPNCTFWRLLHTIRHLSQHVHSPWNQVTNRSELDSNPARREISLDLNHSITASLLGGLAVWNSRWAEGLRLLLLAGLWTEKPTLWWPQGTVKTSSQAAMTSQSYNTECNR